MLRKILGSLAATALVAVGIAVSIPHANAAVSGFVTRSGADFSLNGEPFKYGGTNNYYLHYKSNTMVDDVFNSAQSMGLKVMRAWNFLECGGAKPDSVGGCSAGTDNWMQRWSSTTNAVEYNTGVNGLQKLDYMVASAARHNMRLIMVLTGNWKDFGGMDQYVTWYGGQYHDEFYTSASIKQAYKNWVNTVLSRTNSITGVKYRDDPAIFSWELANEPRCINASLPTSGTCTADTLVNWASEMSTYVKSLDSNHMVSIGDEGFLAWGNGNQWTYNAADGVDHERLTALPNIDFGTYHLYPGAWGQSTAWGAQWITDHNTVGATLNKPEVLEEFGVSDPAVRDAVYQEWTTTVEAGGGDGWLFWILTGVQDDGQLYADYDGFRITYPSTTATLLANQASAFGGNGGDGIPPTKPGTPVATSVTATGATLTWTASTDNVAVTGYTVVRVAGTSETTVAAPMTNTVALTGLTPGMQYTFAVYANDAAGNVSSSSGSVTLTMTMGTVGACAVTYKVTNQWQGGFQGDVTIKNTGTATITGWTLTWTFPNGQTVKQLWNGTVTTNGAEVTVTDAGWNGTIAAGGSAGFGFSGTWIGTNNPPSTFTLNGGTCTVGG